MPRYFFHLHNDITTHDEEGQVLADLAVAEERAMDYARDMVCDSIQKGHLNLEHFIEVADMDGTVLRKVTFREAFTIEG